jgi:hypothetical protein
MPREEVVTNVPRSLVPWLELREGPLMQAQLQAMRCLDITVKHHARSCVAKMLQSSSY